MDLTPYKNCLALTNSIFIANEEKPYRPCCWFKTYIDATDVDDYKNQLAKVDLKYACDYCIKQDEGGSYSYRHQFTDPEELIFTISFDNICNLACITCTPSNSSNLIKEFFTKEDLVLGKDKKYYLQIQKQAPKKIDFIKTTLANTKFKKFRFDILGGEPLVNPATYEFLDWLAEQSYANKSGVGITTNGTAYNEKIVKYLNSFAWISIQLSIDGINDEFEYLRYGAKFDKLEEVCDSFYKLTENENFFIGSHYTLSWMNCLHFAKYFNWAQRRYPKWNIYVSRLQNPAQYSIDLLSIEMKTKIYNQVLSDRDSIVNKNYDDCWFLYKEHMLSTSYDKYDAELLQHGKRTLTASDTFRGNSHEKLVEDFLKFINHKNTDDFKNNT